MVARGRVINGVVVLANGVQLSEGVEVAVVPLLATLVPNPLAAVEISNERRVALQKLVGMWKSPCPPTDDEIGRMLHQAKMTKYG